MKAKVFVIVGLVILLGTAQAAEAQEIANPVIKVLPTAKKSALKLLVAENQERIVEVRFFGNDGPIAIDQIAPGDARSGFLKTYDFQRLKERHFWMSVSTSNTYAVYKITRTGDKVESRLEEVRLQYPMVAAR